MILLLLSSLLRLLLQLLESFKWSLFSIFVSDGVTNELLFEKYSGHDANDDGVGEYKSDDCKLSLLWIWFLQSISL